VDHPVGAGRPAAQAVGVLQRAAVHLGASGGQCRGGLAGPGEAHDLMARVKKLADDGGTDETGRSGNEHAHGALLVLLRDCPCRARHFHCALGACAASKTCSAQRHTHQASSQLTHLAE